MRAHDPGATAARARADAVGVHAAGPIVVRGGGRVRIGTAGWTDRTLTARGVFYPSGAGTPESRLRYYATQFSMVEADAPYYALPRPEMTALWADRTPPGFVIDVKAYALMTEHPAEVARLPKAMREALPASVAAKGRVYPKDLPPELLDEVWAAFRLAIEPLRAAGKLGAVLLQYPRWFLPNAATKATILEAQQRLSGIPCAIEFRNRRWLTEETAARTMRFLEDHALSYVVVDAPQGLQSSVPPLIAATSPGLAIVRLHGHRGDRWEQRGATTMEKYRYLYNREELAWWVPLVAQLARKATETHVVFNNCYANYATTNASEFASILAATEAAAA